MGLTNKSECCFCNEGEESSTQQKIIVLMKILEWNAHKTSHTLNDKPFSEAVSDPARDYHYSLPSPFIEFSVSLFPSEVDCLTGTFELPDVFRFCALNDFGNTESVFLFWHCL